MNDQRLLIAMMDGLGTDYLDAETMPFVHSLYESGFSQTVSAVFPSVTNVNNVSICCGEWPERHGIMGNSYFDPETNGPAYMNAAELIRVPTLFQRAAETGGRISALLTSKRKTVELLCAGAEIAIAAERPPESLVERFGPAPDIYSGEINHWLWDVAIDLLGSRPDVSVLYVHTTDYPMHMWAPDDDRSKAHLRELDARVRRACEAAPDAALLLTADHGMNFKTRAWDLRRVLEDAGKPARFVLSPERDYYIKHHRNLAGCSYIWLNNPADEPGVREVLSGTAGVEEILSRSEAAARFHLPEPDIGDLLVLADRDSMFGDLDVAYEELAPEYRNHGSLYEMEVPLLIHNLQSEHPPADAFEANKDLAAFLFR